jgi:hypothetical protein
MNIETLNEALLENLDEALNARDGEGWFEGLFSTLENIDAATASKVPAAGRSNIAAHCEHLRYVLEIVNAWTKLEKPQPDWGLAWKTSSVGVAEWDALKTDIQTECETLKTFIKASTEWNPKLLNLLMSNTSHVAYHVGAIRQIWMLVRKDETTTPLGER